MTEPDDIASRVTAGLGFLHSGGGDELREHYLWTLDQVMSHLHPENLSTQALVSILAVLIPEHSRFLTGRRTPPGGKRTGRRLRVIR